MVTWYKHDIPDWMDGTEGLDDGLYRVYHVICQLIYLHEGPIENNEHGIAGRCRQHILSFRRNFARLVELGKLKLVDGKITNNRAEAELKCLVNRRATSAKGGRGSAGVAKRSGGGREEVASRSDDDSGANYLKTNDTTTVTLLDSQHHKTREEKTREERKNGAEAPPDLFLVKVSEEKQYFDRSKEVLGTKANGLAAKLLKSKGKIVAVARAVIETASTKSDPLQYVGAVLRASEREAQVQDDSSW